MTARALFAFLLLLGIAGCEPKTDPSSEPPPVEGPVSIDPVATPDTVATPGTVALAPPEPVAEPDPAPVIEDTVRTEPAPPPPPAEAPDATGSVRGVVYHSDGELAAMANVLVADTRLGAATDGEGNYVVVGVPVGSQRLIVTHASGEQATVDVEIAADEAVEHDVTLETDGTPE